MRPAWYSLFKWNIALGVLFISPFSLHATETSSLEPTVGPNTPLVPLSSSSSLNESLLHLAQKYQKGDATPKKPSQYGFEAPQHLEGIPASFVYLGEKRNSYAFVVEKVHHRLSVFAQNEQGEYSLVRTYRAITGKDPLDKIKRGDNRTPEGIYFITGFIPGKELPPKYGKMAFTLDYPNVYDQRRRKTGYGIWIHATNEPERLWRPFDTEGCVVVSNEDLSDLSQFISPMETPLVITKEVTLSTPSLLENSRQKAMEMIHSWVQAWEESNFETYMSFYSSSFISLGMSKEAWYKHKSHLSSMRKGEITVDLSHIQILALEDQLLVTFDQDYRSPQHSDYGKKFLYLKWEKDRYTIIAEKWYQKIRQTASKGAQGL